MAASAHKSEQREQKERSLWQMGISFLSRIGVGFVAFIALGYPLWLGLATYAVVRRYAPFRAAQVGTIVGFGSLILLPVYMMGSALLKSLRTDGNKENTTNHDTDARDGESAEHTDFENCILEPWKTSIDVQQHFNDLELRIRNFAVTLLVTVLGATAFALKEHYEVAVAGASFSLAVAILGAGSLGWLAFYFMDRFWYHQFLIAAVKHTLTIEKKYSRKYPELALSGAIGKGSPVSVWKLDIHSSEKIDLFYAAGLTLLTIVMVLLLAVSTSKPQTKAPATATAGMSAHSETPTTTPPVAGPRDKGAAADALKHAKEH
jgi:hypothetical protein